MSSADISAAQEKLTAAQAERAALTKQLASLRYAADLTCAEERRRSAVVTGGTTPPPSPRAGASNEKVTPRALEAQLLADKAAATAVRQRVHTLEADAAALRRRVKAARHMSAAVGGEGGALSSPVVRPRRGLSLSPTRRAADRSIADFDALVEIVENRADQAGAAREWEDGRERELLPCRLSVSAAGSINIFPVSSAGEEEKESPEGGSEEAPTRLQGATGYKGGRDSLADRLLLSPRSRQRSPTAAAASSSGQANAEDPVLTINPPFVDVSEVAPLVTHSDMTSVSTTADSRIQENISQWMSALPVRTSGCGHSAGEQDVVLCGLTDAVRDAEARIAGHRASPFSLNAVTPAPQSLARPVQIPAAVTSAVARSRSERSSEDEGSGELGFVDGGPSAAASRNMLPVPGQQPPSVSLSQSTRASLPPQSSSGKARGGAGASAPSSTPESTARAIANGLSARLGALGLRVGGGLSGGGSSISGDPSGTEAEVGVDVRAEAGASRPAPGRRGRGRGRTGGRGESPPRIPSKVLMFDGSSSVVSAVEAGQILAHAPSRFSTSPALRLLYSTRVHGISLLSMYGKCKAHAPTLVAVRDSGGGRFGFFATAPWAGGTKPTYVGSGESFCWRAMGEARASGPGQGVGEGDKDRDGGAVEVFKWSRRNKYFQCSTNGYMAVGGGGHFALRLDDDLMRGSSGPCETYASPCLASAVEFECVVLELWAVETVRVSLHRTGTL